MSYSNDVSDLLRAEDLRVSEMRCRRDFETARDGISYDLGANGFGQKPIDFNDFVEAAQQLGVCRLGVNRTINPTIV